MNWIDPKERMPEEPMWPLLLKIKVKDKFTYMVGEMAIVDGEKQWGLSFVDYDIDKEEWFAHFDIVPYNWEIVGWMPIER